MNIIIIHIPVKSVTLQNMTLSILTFAFAIKAWQHRLYTMTTVLEDRGDSNRCFYKLQQLYIYWNSNIRTQVQLILFCTEAPLWIEEKRYHQLESTKGKCVG